MTVPKKYKKLDEHLLEVAKVWHEYPHINGVAQHIAQTYAAPVGTVQRWILVARKMGLIGYKRTVCTRCDGRGWMGR